MTGSRCAASARRSWQSGGRCLRARRARASSQAGRAREGTARGASAQSAAGGTCSDLRRVRRRHDGHQGGRHRSSVHAGLMARPSTSAGLHTLRMLTSEALAAGIASIKLAQRVGRRGVAAAGPEVRRGQQALQAVQVLTAGVSNVPMTSAGATRAGSDADRQLVDVQHQRGARSRHRGLDAGSMPAVPTAKASLVLHANQLARRVGPGPRGTRARRWHAIDPRACAGWRTGCAPVQSAAHAVQHGRIHRDLAALLHRKCIPITNGCYLLNT